MKTIAYNEKFKLMEKDNMYIIYEHNNIVAKSIYKGDMCCKFLDYLKKDNNTIFTVDYSLWGVQ